MNPSNGKIVSVDNKSLVEVDEDNKYGYKYTGNTIVMNGVRCASFTDANGNVYAQPWMLNGFAVKGEKNLNASLTNNQVRSMVKEHIIDKEPIEDLAIKYDITTRHCGNIVAGKAWRHITKSLRYQLINGITASKANTATNKPKGKNKISPNIVPFLVKDKVVSKLSTKAIAEKYCLSERQVQRYVAKAKAK